LANYWTTFADQPDASWRRRFPGFDGRENTSVCRHQAPELFYPAFADVVIADSTFTRDSDAAAGFDIGKLRISIREGAHYIFSEQTNCHAT
jgi:hypothetical protein